jgi:hypothetical protein
LAPVQSWSGAGSKPDGEIFIAGMDHVHNSALYRLHDQVLRYVGDARSASGAANNWKPEEVAEKFHTRPTWLADRVYVATLSSSTLDSSYLTKRGFHWYASDTENGRFLDLSASEPGGVGAGAWRSRNHRSRSFRASDLRCDESDRRYLPLRHWRWSKRTDRPPRLSAPLRLSRPIHVGR